MAAILGWGLKRQYLYSSDHFGTKMNLLRPLVANLRISESRISNLERTSRSSIVLVSSPCLGASRPMARRRAGMLGAGAVAAGGEIMVVQREDRMRAAEQDLTGGGIPNLGILPFVPNQV